MFEDVQQRKTPAWANGVALIIGIGILGFAGYKIYQYFSDKVEKREEEQTKKDAKTELNNELKAGATLSNDNSVYDATANFIQVSLDGAETNQTELEVIKKIAEVVQNKADWLKLIVTFGVRDIGDALSPTSTSYDLPTLLADQLDTSIILTSTNIAGKTYSGYYSNTIDILKDIFKRKNITF